MEFGWGLTLSTLEGGVYSQVSQLGVYSQVRQLGVDSQVRQLGVYSQVSQLQGRIQDLGGGGGVASPLVR